MKFSVFKSTKIGNYLLEIWRGVDQTINAFLGGWARESLSSRLGRTNPNCLLCRILHYIEKEHCIKAMNREQEFVALLNNREKK